LARGSRGPAGSNQTLTSTAMSPEEFEAQMDAEAMGTLQVPRTFREKTGCLMLLLWALWSAAASVWKTAEVIGQLIGL